MINVNVNSSQMLLMAADASSNEKQNDFAATCLNTKNKYNTDKYCLIKYDRYDLFAVPLNLCSLETKAADMFDQVPLKQRGFEFESY